MDGVHDMGGMQGFGPVNPEPEAEEPVFHHEWEGRMLGIDRSAIAPEGTTVDWWRHIIECIRPSDYLSIPYYNKWYHAMAANCIDAGVFTMSELVSGKAETIPENPGTPPRPEDVRAAMAERFDTIMPAEGAETFAIGDAVLARQISPTGHTRLPRYVRGHTGHIHSFHGWHILPDASALGEIRGEPLYSVAFRASDLWPEDGRKNDFVYLDMWESYLERA